MMNYRICQCCGQGVIAMQVNMSSSPVDTLLFPSCWFGFVVCCLWRKESEFNNSARETTLYLVCVCEFWCVYERGRSCVPVCEITCARVCVCVCDSQKAAAFPCTQNAHIVDPIGPIFPGTYLLLFPLAKNSIKVLKLSPDFPQTSDKAVFSRYVLIFPSSGITNR